MSILNGNIAPETLIPDKSPFGEPFRQIGFIPLDGAMDAALYDYGGRRLLAAAGRGRLVLYQLNAGGNAALISVLDGLGDSRQLTVSDGIAYLTARADGLYICDLRDPLHPALAFHVDTLELATGVSCADAILAVTNRHMGCELFDVRDPYHPKRLGDFLCGEAQSVWLHQNLALIGDWIHMRVRIFDISNPYAAVEISGFNVDGFADGVCVMALPPDCAHPLGRTICLSATGHHSARLKNRRKYQHCEFVTPQMLADGYGCGHGVEIFDITHPAEPEYVASIKTPPHFGAIDSWRVYASAGCCYFTDSMNGIFELDLSTPAEPKFTRFFCLLPRLRPKTTPPSIQLPRGAISGMTKVGSCICAAGEGGIYLLEGTADALVRPSASVDLHRSAPKCPQEPNVVFRCGQLHSFVRLEHQLFCACGDAGIAALNDDGRPEFVQPTKGICHDIICRDGLLITAEGGAGAAVYRPNGNRLCELARIEFGAANPVRELVDCGRSIAAQIGSVTVRTLRLSGTTLETVGEAMHFGMLYHRHIARTPAGPYPIVLSLSHGPELLTDDGELKQTGLRLGLETCPIEEGACGFRGGLILIFNRNYYFLPEPKRIAALPAPIACPGALGAGLPFVCGDRLLLLNRVSGTVEILDIADPNRPRFERCISTGLHPEFAAADGQHIRVACGHGGLIEVI